MKTILQIIIVCLITWFIIWLDTLLYDFVIGLIPPTTWIGIIKLIIVIVMIAYTAGIAFWSIVIGSAISLTILDAVMPDKPRRFTITNVKKSKFQERLKKEAEKRRKLDL